MTATVAGIHLGRDTHANRPAANTAPDGSLYACSTHGITYKSNFSGNSWATWAPDSGFEFDYAQFTGQVNVTQTAEASADTVVTGAAVTYDGSTIVIIEFFAPLARPQATQNAILAFWLYDGSSSIGRIGASQNPAATNSYIPVRLARRLTPSAAAHTYGIRATTSSGTAVVLAGAGGAGADVPGFIRITKA